MWSRRRGDEGSHVTELSGGLQRWAPEARRRSAVTVGRISRRGKAWARRVAAGAARCARCGHLILPREPWDLGHADYDQSVYTGPEHRACNRGDRGTAPESGIARKRFDVADVAGVLKRPWV